MKQKSETVTIEKATIWKVTTGIFALLFIVVLINGMSGTTPVPTGQQPTGDETPTVSVDMKKLVDDDAIKGDVNAPVTIVEFSDYECPFCGRHFSQTYSQLVSQYVDSGKVRIVYRDFPLAFHPQAQKAAEAAECAGDQGKYFEMHDKLFQNQASLSVETSKKLAVELGLDATAFNDCLDSSKHAAEVNKDLQDGSAAGVQGTPGFFIGKTDGNSAQQISGAYPFATFQQVIDEELAK